MSQREHRSARRRSGGGCQSAAAVCALALLSSCGGNGDRTGVSLIIKTQTNPYFVSMKQAAQAEAKKTGAHLSVAAGNADGDTQSQINAIDTAIARGDKGILITSNGHAVNAALRQAKDYGLFVIALDTPARPGEHRRHHLRDRQLPGRQAHRPVRRRSGSTARRPSSRCSTCTTTRWSPSTSTATTASSPGWASTRAARRRTPRKKIRDLQGRQGRHYKIACHQATQGAVDGGRTAMEQCLSRNPDINVVYTINEPAGEGAYAALKADNHEDKAFIVSIDGSCQGMDDVENGHLRRRRDAVPRARWRSSASSAIAKIGEGEQGPVAARGQGLPRHRHQLVTAKPLAGIKSQTRRRGHARRCWGTAGG